MCLARRGFYLLLIALSTLATSPTAEPSPATTDLAIELDQVAVATRDNPELPILSDIQWQIRLGDYWVVGAWPRTGKSDLLTTAAGFMRPLQGTVRLFGRDISRLMAHDYLQERLRIGMVFAEGGRPFRNMTVIDNVALALCYHQNCSFKEVAPQVNEVLRLLELTPFAYQYANRISPDWQKRMGLARALLLKPGVLFLDNPLAGMEVRQVGWWLAFLAQLSTGHPFCDQRPVTLVVTTEDFRPWLKQAKQFAMIKDNHLVMLGGPAEVMRNPDRMVRELLADTPQPH